MESENEAALLRQLIADNQNKEAAERLYHWFQGKNEARQDAALALLNRINALHTNVLGGLVAQADADLERNRITKALLELSKQLDEQGEHPEADAPMSKTWIFGVLAIAFAGIIYLNFYKGGRATVPPAFDMTVNVYGPGGESDAITSGKIKMALGAYVLPPQDINSNGQAIFPEIPGPYWDDTIRIIPVGMRYRAGTPSARTAQESRKISVQLAPLPDTTLLRGMVYLSGAGDQPAVGAELDFDLGKSKTRTNENGQFELAAPLAAGKTINLTIRYQGRERFNKEVTISAAQPYKLTLNP